VAHLVFQLGHYDHVSEVLATLHWLHLPQCVDFKGAVMAFRVLHSLAPPYLIDLVGVADLPGHRRLRVIITSTACSIIPAHNHPLKHISSCCIAPLELAAI